MHGSSREPIRSDVVVVGGGEFIVSTAHSRATEPVIGGALPLVGICLTETSHGGCWSCYKVSGHSARKERTEKRTNEPRDDIFSQRDVLLGCCHCCRSCVLVGHENCRCPKIFLLLLLLLRPPKLHDEWPSTFSIIQTVYLAVKKVIVPGLEVPPRGDFHPASIPRGRTVLISPPPWGWREWSPLSQQKGGGGQP